jgi:signal transduction histidine kinase
VNTYTKAITLLVVFFLCSGMLAGQTLMNRDSLLALLPNAKEDIAAVELFINIGQQYETHDPELAKQYYRRAKRLSEKIGYTLGEIKYVTNYGFVLNMQGYYDSTLTLNLHSVELSRKIGDSVYLAKTLFNTGSSYRLKGEYENAVRYYEEGKALMARLGNSGMEAQANEILQNLYTGTKQYRKGVQHGLAAIKGLQNSNELVMLGTAYNNLGLNYAFLRLYDSATICYKEALKIAIRTGDQNMETAQYLNMSDMLIKYGNYAEAKPFLEKALPLSRKLNLHEAEAIALKGLAYCYKDLRDYRRSMSYADSALDIAGKFNFREEKLEIYTHMSNIHFAMQDMKKGDSYAGMAQALSDSLLNDQIYQTTLEMEKKYETQRKNSQILLQQTIIQRKNVLNYLLTGGIIAVILISVLLYRIYRERQKLQQQRINELETEKQLAATEAVLKGEEQERTRMAKDLHDGLGGMLSGIKHSLNTMKGNLIMTPENAVAFERSIDMLDSSIREMRRVAHNMMPETLVKFGLDTALSDYCHDINQSGSIKIAYQSIGLKDAVIEQTTAITLYRIIQELVGNIIRHAAARTAIVQVTKTDRSFTVTVEDDGKGFDPSVLKQARGIGWSNIQNRVEFLKGKLDVKSQPGKGTSVLIEVDA